MKKYFLIALIVGLSTVGFAFFNTLSAAAAPRSPHCQLSSNPQIATGGTVTLVYTVKYLPTTISIQADDTSATPPGTPTVGAPDPERADSQQSGRIVTGPITEDTVFTMTVSNSQGSNDCDVEVPFVPTPDANLRLSLVATLLDLPNQMVYAGPTVGNQNIQSAAYSNGVFAFSGACGGTKDQTYYGSFIRQGGARFFKDDGTFIVERDLCMDGGTIAQSLFMHGGGASQIVADGDRGFFMAVRSHAGSAYGPSAKRAGYYQVSGGNILFSPSSNFIVRGVGSYAAANGKVVGEVEVDLDGGSGRNVTLSTPSLQILAEREAFSVRPIMGFGEYILAGTDGSQNTCKSPITPYGIPTVFRPESDGSLTSVENLTLPDGLCPAKMAIDYTSSPQRLAVTAHTGQSGRNLNFSNRIFLFTSSANGLEPAGELTIPESILSDINELDFARFPAFAVAGTYLVFAGQPDLDERYFSLWSDGELKGVALAPLRRDYGTETIGESATQPLHLFMTPEGKIMAAGINNAYLFDSRVAPGGVIPPGGGGGDLAGMTVGELGRTFTQIIQSGECSPTDPTDFGTPNPFFGCVMQRIISGNFTATLPPTPGSTTAPRVFIERNEDRDTVELFAETSSGNIIELSGPLPNHREVLNFKVSPDKQRVIFLSTRGNTSNEPYSTFELYMVSITGGTIKKLSHTFQDRPDEDVATYKFSPNGQRVVYIAGSEEHHTMELFSVPSVDGTVKKLSQADLLESDREVNEHAEQGGFVISCDGQTVYFITRGTGGVGGPQAFSVSITGGMITELSSAQLPDIQCGS